MDSTKRLKENNVRRPRPDFFIHLCRIFLGFWCLDYEQFSKRNVNSARNKIEESCLPLQVPIDSQAAEMRGILPWIPYEHW